MDIGEFRGVLTALLLVLFLGIWAWSWSRKRDEEFGEAEQLPLEDGGRPPLASNEKDEHS